MNEVCQVKHVHSQNGREAQGALLLARLYDSDVEKWVEECEQCQRRNSSPRKAQAPLETIQAEYPFQKISWDIMGPLPVSVSVSQVHPAWL